MNKTVLFIMLFGLIAFTAAAQINPLNCGNGRYINDIFPAVIKTTGITFGYNTSRDYITSTTYNDTLRLDFYEPASDPAVKRPLIILAFGGSFITGQRSDMDAVCTAFSKKGYATATIDYRLIRPGPGNFNYFLVFGNPSLLADAIIKTSADMKAAIRFFKHDAATVNSYKIDSTRIIIGGYSAGAITALQTAYTDSITENPAIVTEYLNNGGLEGNTDLPAPDNLLQAHRSTGIAGVLNISGGVADTNLVDVVNPPIYSAQGDADELIPYNFGTASFSALTLYGSHLIQARANHIGLTNQLYTIAGGNHESPLFNPYYSQIIAGASAFFEPVVCSTSILPVTLTSFTVETSNCSAVLHWQTATEQRNSYYDVETSADGIRFKKAGMVQSNNATGGANYTFIYQGAARTVYFRLKMADKDGGFTYSPVQKFRMTCSASVQVYPNPVDAQATVTGLRAGMQVQLMNAEGQLLWTQKAFGSTVQLPVATLASGLYFMKVTESDGKVVTNSRLIKR